MVPAGSRTAVQHGTWAGLTSGFEWDRVYPRRYGRHTNYWEYYQVFIRFYSKGCAEKVEVSSMATHGLPEPEAEDAIYLLFFAVTDLSNG